ncbi:MAG: allantoate amidohydrolase [Myxococcales bacterium]|nr:allantoate amidohydrolase [Myxococcales bacterium]
MTTLATTALHAADSPRPPRWAEAAERALARCERLARCSERADVLVRRALTPALAEAHALLREWLEAAGLEVRVDALGNLRARLEGASPQTLLIGSHLDTVPDAGKYDGTLGVVLALSLVEAMASEGARLPFSIEVVAFSDEEGVRFGRPFLGARALARGLGPDDLALVDADGVSLAQAIAAFSGIDEADVPAAVAACALRGPASDERADLLAYLELHIEQGPVLESLDLPLGVVTGIAGHVWQSVRFEGRAGHAGTTPMSLRRDALTAAAELALAVEEEALRSPGLVATVGRIVAAPGAHNVIAGAASLELDVRSVDAAVLERGLVAIEAHAESIARRRQLGWRRQLRFEAPSVRCEPGLRALLADAIRAVGVPVHELPSGAGHDGRVIAALAPIVMLFLRSPGGLSHHPDERVHAGDVALAVEVAAEFLRRFAARFAPEVHR